MPEVQEAHGRAKCGSGQCRRKGSRGHKVLDTGLRGHAEENDGLHPMNEKTSRGQSDERGLKAQALPAASSSRSV